MCRRGRLQVLLEHLCLGLVDIFVEVLGLLSELRILVVIGSKLIFLLVNNLILHLCIILFFLVQGGFMLFRSLAVVPIT